LSDAVENTVAQPHRERIRVRVRGREPEDGLQIPDRRPPLHRRDRRT